MLVEFFSELSPLLQTVLASTFGFLVTGLGAAIVFLFAKPNKKVFACLLAVAAGVMVASSIFSLILPSIEMGELVYGMGWFTASLGFTLGALYIVAVDYMVEAANKRKRLFKTAERKQAFLLFASITTHNVAEGMVIGVAFAAAAMTDSTTTIVGAILLAFGIAVQNFPEGAAVSLPMYSYGHSKPAAFLYGALSAIVEPVFAIAAFLLASLAVPLMPFLLSFGAGAMIGVVLSELIPDAIKGSRNLTILMFCAGFIFMMILDVVLG
ncbi:MAG: ZIP family metal transporter [Firmicutes bacterium]|nr:ZIP family metal transporter [Bacillota bacterium]